MTDATAAIKPSDLRRYAGWAVNHYQEHFDTACAESRARYAAKPRGFIWKRLPTTAEVEAWYVRDYMFSNGFGEGRCLKEWYGLARAKRLLKLGSTDKIYDIRLSEEDLSFLRKFLNHELED
jgi:hypothetical protein